MCEHGDFVAQCEIHPLGDTQDGENLRCMIDLRVRCAQCQTPLLFALPLGVNLTQGATMSFDGTEAHLTACIGIPRATQLAGFTVEASGSDPAYTAKLLTLDGTILTL